jgi:hypothetical protein
VGVWGVVVVVVVEEEEEEEEEEEAVVAVMDHDKDWINRKVKKYTQLNIACSAAGALPNDDGASRMCPWIVSRTAVVVYPHDMKYMAACGYVDSPAAAALSQESAALDVLNIAADAGRYERERGRGGNGSGMRGYNEIQIRAAQTTPGANFVVHCNFGNESLESLTRSVVKFPTYKHSRDKHDKDNSYGLKPLGVRYWLNYLKRYIQAYGVHGKQTVPAADTFRNTSSAITSNVACVFLGSLWMEWTDAKAIEEDRTSGNCYDGSMPSGTVNRIAAFIIVAHAFEKAGLCYQR